MSRQFLNPNTGKPQEDRRGTATALEDKLAFSIGKIINNMESMSERQEMILEATKNTVADLKEDIHESRDYTDDKVDIIKKRQDLFLENLTRLERNRRSETKQILSALSNIKKNATALDDRIKDIEYQPVEESKKLINKWSNVFYKIVVPILTALITALILLLINPPPS